MTGGMSGLDRWTGGQVDGWTGGRVEGLPGGAVGFTSPPLCGHQLVHEVQHHLLLLAGRLQEALEDGDHGGHSHGGGGGGGSLGEGRGWEGGADRVR